MLKNNHEYILKNVVKYGKGLNILLGNILVLKWFVMLNTYN